MKKTAIVMVVLILAVTFAAVALAADKKQPAPKVDKTAQDLLRQEQIAKGADILRSREWIVYFTPQGEMAPKRSHLKTDVIFFKEGKVGIKNFVSRGYNESNYTLSLMRDGAVVWETMQKSAKEGGIVFWRGELRGENLSGFVSTENNKGVREDYSFVASAGPAVAKPEKK